MNTDTPKKVNKPFKYGLKRRIAGVGLLYLFIEFLWKIPFVWGGVFGIYWLFVFTDKTALPLAAITLILSALTFIVYIVMKMFRKGNSFTVGEISLALLGCGLLLLPTFFSIFPQNTNHLDSKRIQNRVYYLAVYPMFDDNYGLYECDPLGIFCKQVYRSGDYTAGFYAKLVYDQKNNQLAIDVNGEGEIYRYKLP